MAAVNPWGNTCPILNISNHFELSYNVALAYADYIIHGRAVSDEYAQILHHPGNKNAMKAIFAYCEYWREVRRGKVAIE